MSVIFNLNNYFIYIEYFIIHELTTLFFMFHCCSDKASSLWWPPGFNLWPRGAIGHVSLISATHILLMIYHPFVLWSRRVFVRRQICLIMQPTEPFSRDLRAIVIQSNFICVYYPSVTTYKVRIIFVVSISIFVLSDQGTTLQFVHPEQCLDGTDNTTVVAYRTQ